MLIMLVGWLEFNVPFQHKYGSNTAMSETNANNVLVLLDVCQ